VLKEDRTIFSVRQRRAALSRSVGKAEKAVADLTVLLDASLMDGEAWAELCDLYLEFGTLDKAVYYLEEELLITPHAWNILHQLS
jgi:tetratricopeptide (TPR) repeat protein